MKVQCPACGTFFPRKRLRIVDGLRLHDKLARCCQVCAEKPDEVHQAEYEAEYGIDEPNAVAWFQEHCSMCGLDAPQYPGTKYEMVVKLKDGGEVQAWVCAVCFEQVIDRVVEEEVYGVQRR